MAHFYGTLRGARGPATRCGSKGSGLEVTAASWDGSITVRLWHDQGRDCFEVSQDTWHGRGTREDLARGTVGKPATLRRAAGMT